LALSCFDYPPQNLRQVVFDLQVAEPQDMYAAQAEIFSSRCVTRLLDRIKVNATIHLNLELMFNAEGVKYETVEGMLPAELEAGETAATYRFPKFLFGRCRLAALLAGGVDNNSG
jgi:hypothetical protein